MTISRSSILKTLAMAVTVGLALVFSASAECQLAIPGLIAECSQFVKPGGLKVPPSDGCCAVVKDLDVPCVCGLVTPDIEKLVSMDNVVYVARTCGVTVQPGTKCGSYTVPPKRY